MADTTPEPGSTASTSASATLPVQGTHQNIGSITLSGNARAHVGNILNFELPEDVSKEIDSLRTAITSAEAACTALHRTLATSRTAGEQLLDIAGWPQQIYQTLGTLQASLRDRDTSDGTLWAMRGENTRDLLDACQATMTGIAKRVGAVEGQGMEPKATEPRIMSVEELQETQHTLRSQKIALSTVIPMVNLYQTMITQEVVDTFKEQLTDLLRRLEDEKAQSLPKALPHYDLERSAIPVELDWALKRYEADTASLLTEAVRRNDPSIQVSSYLDRETLNTAFWSCRTSAQKSSTLTGEDFMPLFLTGLPLQALKTVAVGVNKDDTVAEVRDAILRRLGLEGADFGFVHGNRVLTDVNATIEEYGIESNSTLRCVSFRLNSVGPGPWHKSHNLTILASDGTRVTLQLTQDTRYPEQEIRKAFVLHYNRAVAPRPRLVSEEHITLFSHKKGDLTGKHILANDSALVLSGDPLVYNPQEPVAMPDKTLIAFVTTSVQARERFRRQLGNSDIRARGRFQAQLSTLVEDGTKSLQSLLEQDEDADAWDTKEQVGAGGRPNPWESRPSRLRSVFRPGWILSKGLLSSQAMFNRSRRG